MLFKNPEIQGGILRKTESQKKHALESQERNPKKDKNKIPENRGG